MPRADGVLWPGTTLALFEDGMKKDKSKQNGRHPVGFIHVLRFTFHADGGLKMKKVWVFALALTLLIGGITFILITNQQSSSAEVVASTTKPVEVIKAIRGEIRSTLQLSGTIEPNSQVTVFPKADGKIIEMAVDEGIRVINGQTLAVVEHEERLLEMRQTEAAYQAAQTALDQERELAEIRVRTRITQARAQFSAAEIALQQVKALAEIRTVSQTEGATAALASLEANLERMRRGGEGRRSKSCPSLS